jgi:hypothetical protein
MRSERNILSSSSAYLRLEHLSFFRDLVHLKVDTFNHASRYLGLIQLTLIFTYGWISAQRLQVRQRVSVVFCKLLFE